MAKQVNYDNRWELALHEACGGEYHLQFVQMELGKQRHVLRLAFRQYLLQCYCDHIRDELGPALAPEDDLDVLRLKAALVHHWKPAEVQGLDQDVLFEALTGELSTFNLPRQAYSVVEYLENGAQEDFFGRTYRAGMLAEMVKHHRPPEMDDQ